MARLLLFVVASALGPPTTAQGNEAGQLRGTAGETRITNNTTAVLEGENDTNVTTNLELATEDEDELDVHGESMSWGRRRRDRRRQVRRNCVDTPNWNNGW